MSLDEKDSKASLKNESAAQVSVKQVDEAAALAGTDIEIDPVEAARVKRKIDWHILPLMCRKSLPYP